MPEEDETPRPAQANSKEPPEHLGLSWAGRPQVRDLTEGITELCSKVLESHESQVAELQSSVQALRVQMRMMRGGRSTESLGGSQDILGSSRMVLPPIEPQIQVRLNGRTSSSPPDDASTSNSPQQNHASHPQLALYSSSNNITNTSITLNSNNTITSNIGGGSPAGANTMMMMPSIQRPSNTSCTSQFTPFSHFTEDELTTFQNATNTENNEALETLLTATEKTVRIRHRPSSQQQQQPQQSQQQQQQQQQLQFSAIVPAPTSSPDVHDHASGPDEDNPPEEPPRKSERSESRMRAVSSGIRNTTSLGRHRDLIRGTGSPEESWIEGEEYKEREARESLFRKSGSNCDLGGRDKFFQRSSSNCDLVARSRSKLYNADSLLWPPKPHQFQVAYKNGHRRNSWGSPSLGSIDLAVSSVPARRSERAKMFRQAAARLGTMTTVYSQRVTDKMPRWCLRCARTCRHFFRHFPLHPTSTLRTIFDALFLVVMIYDSVMIPFVLTWEDTMVGWQKIAYWITLGYWTVDLILGFLTGFFPNSRDFADDGREAVMSLGPIAKHYLQTWFLPDASIVLTDWACLLLVADESSYLSRFLRMARLARLLRLVEVFSMGRHDLVWQKVGSLVDTSQWSDVIQVGVILSKQCFFVCWLNHCGSCMWHGLGEWGLDTGRGSWMTEDKEALGPADKYLCGFIWSATTMLGDRPDDANNTPEWAFQATWLMIGFFVSSVIVSNLTEMMWKLTEMKKELTAKRVALRRFLSQQRVDRQLAFDIQREVEIRLSHLRRLTDKDVLSLQLLGSTLSLDLCLDRCFPALSRHPVLRTFSGFHEKLFKSLCKKAVSYNFFAPGKVVFKAEHVARFAFQVAFGRLNYMPLTYVDIMEPLQEDTLETESELVLAGAWIAQQTLWVDWEHAGTLEVMDHSELVTISRSGLIATISWHPSLIPLAQGYAESLVSKWKDMDQSQITDTNDGVDHSVILLGMNSDLRFKFAQPALEELKTNQSWSSVFKRTNFQELEKELKSGKSSLTFNQRGNIQRLVAMSAMRLTRRSDGRLLAQVGKIDPDTNSVVGIQCLWPGKKASKDESPRNAVTRMVAENLAPLVGAIDIGEEVIKFEERDSMSYQGLRTVYAKSIFHATTVGGFENSDMRILTKARRSIRDFVESSALTNIMKLTTTIQKRGRAWTSMTDAPPQPEMPEAFVWAGAETQKSAQPVFMWLTEAQFEEFTNSKEGQVQLKEWVQELEAFSETRSATSSRSTRRSSVFGLLPENLGGAPAAPTPPNPLRGPSADIRSPAGAMEQLDIPCAVAS